jgi:hypothetical protein
MLLAGGDLLVVQGQFRFIGTLHQHPRISLELPR